MFITGMFYTEGNRRYEKYMDVTNLFGNED